MGKVFLIILGLIAALTLKRPNAIVDANYSSPRQCDSRDPASDGIAPIGAEDGALKEQEGNKQKRNTQSNANPGEAAIVEYTKQLATWTRVLAILTGFLMLVTAVLGAIAFRTDNTLKETMTRAQRAWVGPYDASIEPLSVQKVATATISIRNTGREPALNVHFDVKPAIFGRETTPNADDKVAKETADQLKACRAETSVAYGQVIYPSSGQENTQIQITVPADLITQPVIDGKNAIIIRGCAMYDTFGATRHSTFCFFLSTAKPSQSILASAREFPKQPNGNTETRNSRTAAFRTQE